MLNYYVIYNMVWDVFSCFHYLFDSELSDEASKRAKTWLKMSGEAADWLMNERGVSITSGELTDEDLRKLDTYLDEVGDKIIYHAAEKIRKASSILQVDDLQTDEIQLYHYISWVTVILDYLDKLLVDDNSETAKRYLSSQLFASLKSAIKTEVQSFEELNLAELSQSSKQCGIDLLNYWKQYISTN